MPSVLITGSNRGIGLELTRQYVEAGWCVWACCREPKRATELQKLREHYPNFLSLYSLDVTDHAAIDELARELKGAAIDVLINNAGVGGQQCSADEINYRTFRETLEINAISPLKIASAFHPHTAKSERRVLVTITSALGSIGLNTDGGWYDYRASKAAVNAIMKSLALDLQPQGITVVVIHPGWVKTDMGGPEAPLGVAKSVAGIRKVIDQLTLTDSGKFLRYDGTEVPW